jgi:hypothetical protein
MIIPTISTAIARLTHTPQAGAKAWGSSFSVQRGFYKQFYFKTGFAACIVQCFIIFYETKPTAPTYKSQFAPRFEPTEKKTGLGNSTFLDPHCQTQRSRPKRVSTMIRVVI